jgi:prephenate dehydratase
MSRVAIQGELGSFSEQAAVMHFHHPELLTCRTFDDVAATLDAGDADYAVLPIENRIAGTVEGTRSILARSSLVRVAEIEVRIHMCLMALPGTTIDELKVVLSHPVALAQIGKFLRAHPHITAKEFYDTAGAAQHIASLQDREVGAIAARGAANRYGLEILAENIEDRSDNYTRFAVLKSA